MSKKRSKIVTKRRKSSFSLAPLLKKGVLALAVIGFLLWAGVSLRVTGTIDRTQKAITHSWVSATADMGFVVKNIYVEGRYFLDRADLAAVTTIKKNDPLLGVNPEGLGEKISALNWVKSVKVSRQLPDSVKIEITERVPMALLRNADKSLSLVDWDGHVITYSPDARFANLIIVTGKGAAEALPDFLPILAAEEGLFKEIASVQYVGERRWNLFTQNNMRIQLPEDEIGFALARVARENETDDLLAQALSDIDARYPDRLIVQAKEGAEPKLIKTGHHRK
ncbi:MAG: hypothetical protein CMH25_06240 [Micavibrio sp.]|nr:hypothetical protein [Micavibrio sp.]